MNLQVFFRLTSSTMEYSEIVGSTKIMVFMRIFISHLREILFCICNSRLAFHHFLKPSLPGSFEVVVWCGVEGGTRPYPDQRPLIEPF